MRKIKFIVIVLLSIFSSSFAIAQTAFEKAQQELDNDNENKALSILEGSNFKKGIKYFNLLGKIWLKKGNGEKALSYFEKAKDNLKTKAKTNYTLIGDTYNNIAVALWSMGKKSQALQYHQVALQNREKSNDSLSIAASLNNIGLTYASFQPNLAVKYYVRALNIYKKKNLKDKIATSFINIGLAYSFKKEYNKALVNLNKALNIRINLHGKNSTPVAFVYSSLASVFLKTKEYNSCIKDAKNALNIYKEKYGEKHPEISITYNLLGDVLFEIAKKSRKKEDFELAINSYKKAILANLSRVNHLGRYEIPPIKNYLNADIYLVSILRKALVYEAYHTQYSLKMVDLEQAYKLLILADNIIDNIRHFRTYKKDKIALGNISSDVYESAIRVSLQMAELKWKKRPYQEKAFYYADKSKSAVLLDAIADANAKSFAGIPDELLQKEKKIKRKITYLEQKLGKSIHINNRKTLATNLLKWEQTYNSFKKELEQNYPNYFALKFDTKIPSIQELQAKIAKGTTLISYFIGDNNSRLYVFYITDTKFKIQDITFKEDLNRNIIGYRNALYYRLPKTINSIGNKLYKQFGLNKIPRGTKKLIIVPSGRISTIPLETLIMDKNDPNSYLIQRYNISYLYTAGFMRPKNTTNLFGDISLFAPIYFREQGLCYLPGTEKEIEEISSVFKQHQVKTNLFIKKNASKKAVSSAKVAKSKIVHFATHGIVDELHPERSQICLSSEGGSEGGLFTGDIYNLKFDADLMVLSACETGLGKLSKGEGIIGLTRAMIYAGANNIVVSFWSVADKSTSQLMIDFYSNMLCGQNYSRALANAKQKMIKSEKYGNPYYWAPFVLIGY